jgi:hypothetical protein
MVRTLRRVAHQHNGRKATRVISSERVGDAQMEGARRSRRRVSVDPPETRGQLAAAQIADVLPVLTVSSAADDTTCWIARLFS